jgi:Zn-dependent alcohol dehydrogenase
VRADDGAYPAGGSFAAAVCDGDGRVAVAELRADLPGPGEVAVRIVASGICHTDLRSLEWGRPLVLGHEGAGVVEATGQGTSVAVGTPVVLNWATPCGRCGTCSRGRPALCESRSLGDPTPTAVAMDGTAYSRSFLLGTLAEFAVVRESSVTPVPTSTDLEGACAVGCAVLTAFGSVTRVAHVRPGDAVAVIGTGGVGLHVVQAAIGAGATRVVAIDRRVDRLAAAAALGATDLVEAGDDVSATIGAVAEKVAGGVDHAFECTGVAALAGAPLQVVRDGGTAVYVSGGVDTIAFDLTWLQWDKRFVNPLYGSCRPALDVPAVLALHAAGRWELGGLLGERFALAEVSAALEAARAGGIGKVVVVP